MTKPHGNTGNQHAAKGHDAALNIRAPAKDKAKWQKQAAKAGLTLTDFVVQKLNG